MNLYIATVPHVEQDIFNEFNEQVNIFLNQHFGSHNRLEIFNFGMTKNDELQIAITHKNTDVILFAVQSTTKKQSGLQIVKKANGEKIPKDNYLLCTKIAYKFSTNIDSKIRAINNILNDSDCLEINTLINHVNSSNIFKKEESSVEIDHEVYDVTGLMEKASLLPQSNSIEETKEYKKWEVYLRLLEKKLEEKSASFEVPIKSIERLSDISIRIKKPDNSNIKIKSDDEILVNYNDQIISFGKVINVYKDTIELELCIDLIDFNTNILDLFVNHIGTRERLKIFNQAMNKMKFSDFRFYIFGDQKLPKIKSGIKISFQNNSMNQKQQEAVIKAINSEKLFMIQGPPGTGKTTVIAEIAYQEKILGHKVLISSESNDAVENALERLDDNDFYPLIYQSVNREEKTFDDVLPTDLKAGSFYKMRIINTLKKHVEMTKNNDNYDSIRQAYEVKKQSLFEKKKKFREFENDMNMILTYESNLDIKINELEIETNQLINESKRMSKFKTIQEDFFKELENNEDCEKELRSAYLDQVNIVGATLGQINKASKNEHYFDVVIVDEVSKAMPIELSLAVLNADKVIFVGDQKQLPPMLDRDITIEEFAENLFEISDDNYDIENDVLQELHDHVTIFEKLIDHNPDNYVQLTTQYRMHEKIQKAINFFYNEKLECGVDSNLLSNIHTLFKGEALVWLDSQDSREIKQGTSYYNEKEIDYTKRILRLLNEEYGNSDKKPSVGIITFYGSQVKKLSSIGKRFNNLKVDYGTVDTFQGQERDFIIVSMVRSESLGFARSLNRINVAFSRAKQLLIILGNSDAFCKINNYDREDIRRAKKVYKNVYDISFKGSLS